LALNADDSSVREERLSVAKVSQGTSSRTIVADCVDGLGDILPAFVPSPPVADRSFWAALPEGFRDRLIADGKSALASDWPQLMAGDYRAFTRTGDRVSYETAYFARRRRLNALALAEAVEAEGNFIDALIDGIVLVCEESGWQLPAHNSQVRDGAHDPLPDPDRPVIDLFAAETGAQLAVIASLLGDALNAACPGIVRRIDREIETRITRPYLDRHFWWMGHGDERMNNWTPWCTQNVLISTFTRPTNQPTRRAVITKAARSLDAFLKDYGEDGACDEGALYYRRAALCLFGALKVMDAVAPGVFSALWHLPKLRNMAEYLLHVHVDGAWYINFADASAVLEPSGAREFLFGKKVGSEALCALAADDARANPRPDLPDEINLFERLLALLTAREMSAYAWPLQKAPDIYYPSCGLFVARDERFVVAVKAGDNDDNHNHNDVGSVTLYVDGLPLLIDVGVETYTAKTFSPRRYEIWSMQSGFHNLPRFEGIDQEAGAGFAARDVRVDLGDTRAEIAMDIAGAYPADAGVSRYRRVVTLKKGRGVEIVDRHEGARRAELSLMFSVRPVLSDGLILVGGRATIALVGAGTMRLEEIPVADPRLRQAWPERLFRVLVPLEGTELRLFVEPSGVAP
jgi:hypothetical protein